MHLKTPHSSTCLRRDQVPVSAELSTKAIYCLHGISNQEFYTAKAREGSPIRDAMSHYPGLFALSEAFFSKWGAEELHFLWEKKVFTFGGKKAMPQLDLPWPGYQRHPCVLFSPHSFFHSLIPDTSPKPPHISPKWYPSFCLLTLPPVLAVPPPPPGPATTLCTAETALRGFRKTSLAIQREKSTLLLDS